MQQQVTLSKINHANRKLLANLAALSHKAAQQHSPSWLQSVDAALREIRRTSEDGVLTSVALAHGRPKGWIAARQRGQLSWEIHPLLVEPAVSGQGYGKILVLDIERKIRSHGGTSVFLSTSDATNSTNLRDFDLYADPLRAIRNIAVRDTVRGHAYQFWQRVGFTVVGVIPDAEGPGVPSIHLAKKL
jgi:aminoglycoside 6'-N-acetyltransferase I